MGSESESEGRAGRAGRAGSRAGEDEDEDEGGCRWFLNSQGPLPEDLRRTETGEGGGAELSEKTMLFMLFASAASGSLRGGGTLLVRADMGSSPHL